MNDDGARLTAPVARALLAAGLGALEARKQEINDLNVYPVPDGDTGTNLALTVRSLLNAATKMPEQLSEHDLCAGLTQAALMGARGNSGVILSQIIRGAMEVLGRGELVTPRYVGDPGGRAPNRVTVAGPGLEARGAAAAQSRATLVELG